MKILHIVSGDLNGGAARGAYWLHKALNENGIDSKIYTNSRITLDYEKVVTTNKTKKDNFFNSIRYRLDKIFLLFYRSKMKRIFSTGFFGINFTKSNEYKEADIIHLHWINGGFVNIKHLSKIDKPLVWTIRDMWPMTGGCHYSLECDQYKTGCGNCKQLNSNRNYDLSKFVLNRKKKYLPKNIKIVGISQWLSDEAKKSELFKNFDVRTISNNIEIKEFFPIKKNKAKEILGIKTNKQIILCGAGNLKDFYKGFSKFIEAIQLLSKDKYFLCFFGNMNKSIIEPHGFEFKSFGYLNDSTSLRLLYSCANVFVAPSLMEAFGKTLAESMACGTPVVAFGTTGLLDIVDHRVNGYLAKPFDTNDLAQGIDWVLNAENYSELCKNARDKALKEFDSKVVAKKYIALYKKILKN